MSVPGQTSPQLTYDQDGLSTIHNADFMRDPQFQRAIARAARSHVHIPIEWRIHVVLWAAQNAMAIEGYFLECGVNRGFTSSAILDFLDWNAVHGTRRYFLMDTFKGLVDTQVSDEERALGRLETFKPLYTECFEEVRQNFAEFEDVILVRGAIPDTLTQVPNRPIAFMHVDMNCAAPEVAALRHFWPRLSPGAFVILDDYAYQGYEPQKRAIDELGRSLGFSVLSLPTGGGMIVKPATRRRLWPWQRLG